MAQESGWVLENPINQNYIPTMGVGAFIWEKMIKFGPRVIQTESDTGKSETYNELLSRAVRTALRMEARGITPGDMVSICTYNHKDSWTPIAASFFLDVRMSPIDPNLSLDNATNLLKLTKPRLMFCVPEALELVMAAISNASINCEIVVFGETTEHTPFSEFLSECEHEEEFKPKTVDNLFDTAIVLFSSGTTGRAKAVNLTHYGILYQLQCLKENIDFKVSFYLTSPYWISNIVFRLVIMSSGGLQVLSKEFHENTFMEITEKYKVTFLFLTPSLTFKLTSSPKYFDYDTSSLTTFITGGSVIPEIQMKKIKKLLPNANVKNVYGMTELAGVCTIFNRYNHKHFLNSKLVSCGCIVSGMSAKVVDIETREILGPNKKGELLIRTKSVMNGYFNDEQETKDSYDQDGFFKTGDIVYFDDELCFYVVDRLKEMFKYRSWRIIPSELENILLSHSDIEEAVVIGLPHEIDGDHTAAIVVLKSGSSVNEQDIIIYFNDLVTEEQKIRAGVKFVSSIITTSTGKYCRYKLREMILNGEL